MPDLFFVLARASRWPEVVHARPYLGVDDGGVAHPQLGPGHPPRPHRAARPAAPAGRGAAPRRAGSREGKSTRASTRSRRPTALTSRSRNISLARPRVGGLRVRHAPSAPRQQIQIESVPSLGRLAALQSTTTYRSKTLTAPTVPPRPRQ